MTNKDKAKKLAEEYFPISDWDADEITSEYNQNDCKQAVLAMAEWKDQQFKEYLEGKRADIEQGVLHSNPLIDGDRWCGRADIINEIINELFPDRGE